DTHSAMAVNKKIRAVHCLFYRLSAVLRICFQNIDNDDGLQNDNLMDVRRINHDGVKLDVGV
ncbi:MAG: hypothetical protein LBT81_00945, partial [Helicobacteraceae bacterium]|nr:hypothetical protein [Helicobacteraceae bacterium]